MPADDLVLNVRQIGNYPPVSTAIPSDAVLLQRGGIGGPYVSISPSAFVSTALSTGGDMAIGGQLLAASVQAGSAQISNAAINALSATTACVRELNAQWGAIAGVPIATTEFASGLVAGLQAATVWSFNGRRGDVSLWLQDVLKAGGAPIYSPRFMGAPMADTPAPGTCNSRLATTAFVHGSMTTYIDALLADHPFVFTFNGRTGDIVLTAEDVEAAGATLDFAPIDSPNFTGNPTAPTAPPGSQTGQIATTAFVMNAVQESTTGVASFNGRTGIVALSAADLTGVGGALLASPNFTGTPTAPTAAPGTDSSQIATTAWVINELGGVTSGVQTFNGRAGAVTLTLADVTGVGGAPLADPAFNGVPTAPTAASGVATQQIATTAFVMNAVTGGSVVSFNGRTGIVSLLANDLSAAGGALLNSPAFSGVPTAPTAAPATSTTQLATCAFVAAAVASVAGVTTFNGRAGAVTLTIGDVTTAFPAGTALPLVDGTASAGTAPTWSRSDHVHPTDTSRYSATNPSGFQTASQVSSALAAYLPLTGGALTGQLNGTALGMSGTIQSGASVTVNSSQAVVYFYNGGPQVGYVGALSDGGVRMTNSQTGSYVVCDASGNFLYVNGSGYAQKIGGGEWAAPSDARIKSVLGGYELGLAEVLRLNPVRYVYKGNDASPEEASPEALVAREARPFVGLIAQEAELVFPNMVTRREGWIDGAKVWDFRSLDASELTYALINAVKQLVSRIEALEARA